jgi:hypothetical protein
MLIANLPEYGCEQIAGGFFAAIGVWFSRLADSKGYVMCNACEAASPGARHA